MERVAVYLLASDDDTDCIACHFTVERFVEMLHRSRMVFCVPHAQVAVAHGNTLTRPVPLLAAP